MPKKKTVKIKVCSACKKKPSQLRSIRCRECNVQHRRDYKKAYFKRKKTEILRKQKEYYHANKDWINYRASKRYHEDLDELIRNSRRRKMEKYFRDFGPKLRSECECGDRPCFWFGCRHNMAPDHQDCKKNMRVEEIKTIARGMKETCVLDVANRGPSTLEEVGQILGITKQRVGQIETKAIARFQSHPDKVAHLEAFLVPEVNSHRRFVPRNQAVQPSDWLLSPQMFQKVRSDWEQREKDSGG